MKFRKHSQKVLTFDAFIPPYNFVTHLNRVFEQFADQLNKLTFLFDNLIKERAMTIKKEVFGKLEEELSGLDDVLTNLDQKRNNTKEVQEKFFQVCEELLQLNSDLLQPDSKVTKEAISLKKSQKQTHETTYRTFYVA